MRYAQLLFERNILNVVDIEKFVKQAANSAHNPEVKKWLLAMLPAYLKKNYQKTKPVSSADLHKFFRGVVPEWATKGIATGDLLTVILDNELKNKISSTIDYLESEVSAHNLGRIPFEEALKRSEAWHAQLAQSQEPIAPSQSNGEVIFRNYPDRYTWVMLTTEACLDFEGNQMGHCVGKGGYDDSLKSGETKFFSLRDPQRKSHVTVEIKNNSVKQVKGKQNETPVPKYRPYVIDLLNNLQLTDEEDSYDIERMGIFHGQKGFGFLTDVAEVVDDLSSGHKWVILNSLYGYVIDKNNTPLVKIEFGIVSLNDIKIYYDVPPKLVRNDIIGIVQSVLKNKPMIERGKKIGENAAYTLAAEFGLGVKKNKLVSSISGTIIAHDLFFRAFFDKEKRVMFVVDADNHPLIYMNFEILTAPLIKETYTNLQPGWQHAIPVFLEAVSKEKITLNKNSTIAELKKKDWFLHQDKWQPSSAIIKDIEPFFERGEAKWYDISRHNGWLWLMINNQVRARLQYRHRINEQSPYPIIDVDTAFNDIIKDANSYVVQLLDEEIVVVADEKDNHKDDYDDDPFLMNYDILYDRGSAETVDWNVQVNLLRQTTNVKDEVVAEERYKLTLGEAASETSQNDDHSELHAFAKRVIGQRNTFAFEWELEANDAEIDPEPYYSDAKQYRVDHRMKPTAKLPKIQNTVTSVWL